MQHYLLDENLSRKLTGPLSAALGDVSHVANEGLNNAFDLDIWEFAKKRSGIILTKDTDYVGLSDLKGCPPKVIQLSCGNKTTEFIEALLLSHVPTIKDFAQGEKCYLEIL